MSSKESGNKVMMTTQVKTVLLYPIPSLIFLAAPSGVVSGFSFVGPDDVLSFRKLEDSHHWDFNQMFLKNSSNGWTHKKWIGLILVTGCRDDVSIGKSEKTGGKWMMFQRFSAFGYFLGLETRV